MLNNLPALNIATKECRLAHKLAWGQQYQCIFSYLEAKDTAATEETGLKKQGRHA